MIYLFGATCMFIDHLYTVIPDAPIIIRMIGRFAMPIFTIAAGYGALYTSDPLKYAYRLMLCAASYEVVRHYLPGDPAYSLVWIFALYAVPGTRWVSWPASLLCQYGIAVPALMWITQRYKPFQGLFTGQKGRWLYYFYPGHLILFWSINQLTKSAPG